jgi:hypothetical protein
VPQSPQNSRWPWDEERWIRGAPAWYSKDSTGQVAQASTGAPLERWHSRQWQYPASLGAVAHR